SYLANSPLVSQILFKQNGALRMTTTKQWDYVNRLTSITNLPSAIGSSAIGYSYKYNEANQRTAVTNSDASFWIYAYDPLGQVTSGKRYWPDGTPVAGQQFEYTFDDIGNRKTTGAGGDNNGANLRTSTYGANSLNQYTNRTVPGFFQTLGSANSNATISLWRSDGSFGQASRHGEYFRGEIALNNLTGAVWLTLTNLAVLQNGTNADIVTNTVGSSFIPGTLEAFTYDLDGNLTSDGRWTYHWDAENRLVRMVANTIAGPQQR